MVGFPTKICKSLNLWSVLGKLNVWISYDPNFTDRSRHKYFYDFVVFYEFNKQLLDEGKQK